MTKTLQTPSGYPVNRSQEIQPGSLKRISDMAVIRPSSVSEKSGFDEFISTDPVSVDPLLAAQLGPNVLVLSE